MMSSLRLLEYLESSYDGCFHLDATYKLIKNGFALIVFGKTDSRHKFYSIAFGISSHEQEEDYSYFYSGLDICKSVNINFSPKYKMQDACLASYNAALSLFPEVKILMCYFHVRLNCRKNKTLCPKNLYDDSKNFIYNIHMSHNTDAMLENCRKFRDFGKENCPDFYSYVYDSWLKSNIF